MMIQTDKERLAVSSAIALLLYAGFFAATARLNILNPAGPREYFGPLAVQVTLQKPEPQKILPEIIPEPVVKPVIKPATVKPIPQPTPKVTPQPMPVPQPAPKTASQPTSVPQPTPTSQPGAQPAQTIVPATAGVTAAAETRPAGSPASLEAVPVKTPQSFGTGESVSMPPSKTGSQFFESVRPETPTDQFGENKVVVGDITPTGTRGTVPPSPVTGTNKPSFIDPSKLDSINFNNGTAVTGDGTNAGSAQTAGEVIVARDFAELMSRRKVTNHPDPDLSGIRLPGDLRSMEVEVTLVILPNGKVIDPKFTDTGDSNLNTRIKEALRKWTFEPIQQDKSQTAHFSFIINAVN